MSDGGNPSGLDQPEVSATQPKRIFLVVVDESEEMQHALRFACRRAKNTDGRVALLHVIEPSDFQHWMAVGDLMREEARTEAEQLLQKLAAGVHEMAGSMPVLYVREGDCRDELFKLLDEEPQVSILVLGAKTGSGGPGPLVVALTGKFLGKLRVPITLVPDNLDDETIDSIS
ncbi:universal stress protein [Denitrobaculum tricleocarpae]|uniref:Universal stress protein n=1 Tax=Denitrobaculum tricleocarpae TaxID=2591009 RepID=A0A545TRQ8_9PROT|nr:universal stress protein [Denitrobaculum tricleocarpae]TQV79902.1 universal stress protein [Denitrobaculum tricleocarpae]